MAKKQRAKLTEAEKKRRASKRKAEKKRLAASQAATLSMIAKKAEAGMHADQAEIPPVEEKLIRSVKMAKAAEPPTPVQIVPPPVEVDWAAVEATEEFQRGFIKAMDMFAEFIVCQRDKPEEPRIFMFPAYMHIKEQDCAREIVTLYSPVAPIAREFDPIVLEDLKLIQEGIEDSISILQRRTRKLEPHLAFPSAGERALKPIEYEVLLELTVRETRLWYRIQPVDLMKGYIEISSQDLDAVSDPAGTRIRTWLTMQNFTRHFYMVLGDDSLDDEGVVDGLIQESDRSSRGYAKFFRRWREAEKI